ncbi:MAG TPA: glycerol kinase GlpK [Polyangia bacterium]|nr:glycerol kinase GlpK [Polyangia bacterium]
MSERKDLVLAIDQGTTGTTVLIVDPRQQVRGRGYREFAQIYPRPGEVEHDPEAIWASVAGAMEDALRDVNPTAIAALGITNQRETTLLWERDGGRPVGNAIVWQDRRTADICAALKAAGHEALVRERTGLVLDPYFSATKIRWLLDNVTGLRARAEAGALAFGTVDSFLIWRLSGGRVHATDVTNASRTLLLDLHSRRFSDDLCQLFGVPRVLLPEVRPSSGLVAVTRAVPGLPDGIPIAGVAGDQQAALYGQDCTMPGDAKCTYGTGAFLLANVGDKPIISRHGLLGTVAWTLEGGGAPETAYALEGSAFIAGALVQWLRDGLGIIDQASEIEALARSVSDSGGVTIVPALAGLGAPHWQPEARGIITGLSRGTTRAHIARAALEAIALQNVDLVRAMEADAGRAVTNLRVDGGAAANNLLLQIQADLLGVQIFRPEMVEATALGAAKLAARGIGLPRSEPVAQTSRIDIFNASQRAAEGADKTEMRARWQRAVRSLLAGLSAADEPPVAPS